MPLAVMVVQLLALKTALFQERQTAIAAQVESAVSIVKRLAGEATAGKLTEAEAQDRAKRILRSVRFGQNDLPSRRAKPRTRSEA